MTQGFGRALPFFAYSIALVYIFHTTKITWNWLKLIAAMFGANWAITNSRL